MLGAVRRRRLESASEIREKEPEKVWKKYANKSKRSNTGVGTISLATKLVVWGVERK